MGHNQNLLLEYNIYNDNYYGTPKDVVFEKKYDVVLAHNGQEAIELLNSSNGSSISCIFLDLIMPELDGFSVLDYLNDNNYLNKLPVIIISGNYDKETRNRAYSYRIADMLEKPFNLEIFTTIPHYLITYSIKKQLENKYCLNCLKYDPDVQERGTM